MVYVFFRPQCRDVYSLFPRIFGATILDRRCIEASQASPEATEAVRETSLTLPGRARQERATEVALSAFSIEVF